VTHLLGAERVAEDLADLILEKTEGIPFFIEEFVKSLRDLGIIERHNFTYALTKDAKDVAIPSTIQDVILARVDALPEDAKEVLQTGSVIEREFPYELIHRVTNLPEKDLLSRLSVLEDTELLYERGIYPQSAYIFKHSLTREVVYGAILAKKRRELHRAVGEAMEALYQKSLAAHLGTLCDHFIAGENYEKGESYARLAARKVEKSGSLAESIDYEKNRIACLERLPKAEEIERRLIDARVTLGLYHMQVDQLQEAKAAVDPVIERVRAASPGRRLGQIYTILGNHSYWVSEDFENTFRYLGEAIRISEVVHDPVSGVLSHYSYGLALAAQCQFEAAIDHVRIAYDINAAARSLWGMATMKSVLSSVPLLSKNG
jgi:tetratricopeptide (TPR) repeat protein